MSKERVVRVCPAWWPLLCAGMMAAGCGDDGESSSGGASTDRGPTSGHETEQGEETEETGDLGEATGDGGTDGEAMAGFFRFTVTVDGESTAIDTVCDVPALGNLVNDNLIGEDLDAGFGVSLAWRPQDVVEPTTIVVDQSNAHLYNFSLRQQQGNTARSLQFVDATLVLDVVENGHWSGQFTGWSRMGSPVGSDAEVLIQVDDGSFDCWDPQ